MRQFTLLGLLFIAALAFAQDEPINADVEADGAAAAAAGDEEAKEECEEAWDYVEFMKKSLKDKIEETLQETLFQQRPLLEETVTQAMEKVLEMRDDILERTKAIRSGEIEVCPGQNIKQEEFLTQIRMQIMSILLSLIEKDAASTEKLQDVGKQLLAIRTKVNVEVTRMIMLREATSTTRNQKVDDCDCGIMTELKDGLEGVLNLGEDKKEEGDESEDGDSADDAAAPDQDDVAIDAKSGDEASPGDDIESMTMLLMTVDAEIKTLYNKILGELDDEARAKLSDELQTLKGISLDMHDILSKMSELDPVEDAEALARISRRDVRSLYNDVKRLYDQCQQNCPGECKSCGAEKIDEISEKMKEFLEHVEILEEDEAKETIRTDLMAYLTQMNSEMTELLKEKAENEELDSCGNEQLEVIDKIKGPLWMMVNITIFGDAATMGEMITALEQAMKEMRATYCAPEETEERELPLDTDECDLNELNTARDWIVDIDETIATDIFKNEDDEGRRNAMLKLIELKSGMDDRVRELFQDNLQCKEEVEQIKNVYAQKLTECLAEMMNPRFRFDLLGRADRVQCTKDLRILIEDRRGVLLMREIEARINGAQNNAQEA